MAGLIWYLKTCDLFERLSDAEAERLNRHALVRKFKKKAVVYAPAEAGQTVLVLATGRVKIYGSSDARRPPAATTVSTGGTSISGRASPAPRRS